MAQEPKLPLILLYDGVCGLCNRTVQFVLRRDRDGVFRFASLQSRLGRDILDRHALSASDLDTFYVVIGVDPAPLAGTAKNERLLSRSDAVSIVLQKLGGFWRIVGALFGRVPRDLRDWMYNLVARRRYRVFGRYEACPLPSEADRQRFLDV